MRKHTLMLSAAVAALMAGTGSARAADCADLTGVIATAAGTCLTDDTEKALVTSSAGSIAIFDTELNASDSDNEFDGGTIKINTADTPIITLNSDSFVYVNGTITNAKVSGASAIKVDTTVNPDASALTYENYDEDTVEGVAIYIDESGGVGLSGDGEGKYFIWLDSDGGTGSLTGDIIVKNGATISMKGNDSYGIYIDSGSTLNGDLVFAGTLSMYQSKANQKVEASGMVGIKVDGTINGDLVVGGSGTVYVVGQGADGITVAGSVNGNITISSTVSVLGVDSTSLASKTGYSYYYSGSTKKRIYAEGGNGLTVNSSVANGILIDGANYSSDSSSSTGSISVTGTGYGVLISPADGATAPLVIGVYKSRDYEDDDQLSGDYITDASLATYNPGFGFYNRGTISISPANAADLSNNITTDDTYDVTAVAIVGGSSATTATIIEGGIYNSGAISASATTDDDDATVAATGLSLTNYTFLGGSYDSTTGTYTAATYDYSCAVAGNGVTTCALTSAGDVYKDDADQYALVNSNDTGSGQITAAVSGDGGGTAIALYIGENSVLSALYNSGTISATAATNNTDITTTLAAYGIKDDSGTLTYIYNIGTISAATSSLDDESEIAYAIDLTAVTAGMDAYDGITIVNEATSSSSATITGDIMFGEGSNQVIYLSGAGSSYYSSITGDIHYGYCGSDTCTSNDLLSIGAFGYVTGNVTADSGVSVQVYNNGILYLTNDEDSGALNAVDFTVNDGGALSIGVTESSTLNATGVIQASGNVTIAEGANLGLSYYSYINGGEYVLISSSGGLTIGDLETYSNAISKAAAAAGGAKPYLFQSADLVTKYYDASGNEITSCTGQSSCSVASSTQELVLEVEVKTADQLGLTGYAKQLFQYANVALGQDDNLGAAMIAGIHADADDPEDSYTGAEAKGSSSEAQAAYNSFAPNVTDGTRAIAISITDQASGVVGARMRSLNMYAKQHGEMTLWAQEFVQMIKTPGQGVQQADDSYEKNGFKDHGFGFVLGLDAGNPRDGWFGGALTFYNGDVNEIGRNSHENQLWVLATGYGVWRGKGFFFNGKLDAGYGHIKGTRFIYLKTGTGDSESYYLRTAQNSHAAALVSGGFSTGVTYTWGALTVMPQLSVDGLYLREDGYTEENPSDNTMDGDGFNLKVGSYDTKSLRAFLGSSVRYDIDLWGVYLQPELRLGYRYDFATSPVKLDAAFKDIDATTSGNQHGDWFSLTGPDPTKGHFLAGGSLGATTGDWSISLHFDLLRGDNGAFEEVGTFNLIGRL